MWVTLDGKRLTGRVDGLENLEVTYNLKDDSESPTVSFVSELTFYDDGYDLIKEQIVDDNNGRIKQLDIQIYDECCEAVIFDGIVAGDKIDWCEDECFITATLSQNDEVAKKIRCFKSTLVTDNRYGIQDADHPAFIYCKEIRPQFVHDLIISFGILQEIIYILIYSPFLTLVAAIRGLLAAVSAIFNFLENLVNTTINVIINAVNLILAVVPVVSPIDPVVFDLSIKDLVEDVNQILTDKVEEAQGIRDDVRSAIVGCNRKHPSALVRDYVNNACKICGLTFESSILNDPSSLYYNTAYFNAPIKKGIGINKAPKLIEDNLPILTGARLLDQLKPVFNAEWTIRDNRVLFERKDQLRAKNIWKDIREFDVIDSICYSWIAEKSPAYIDFKYADDVVDTVGSENRDRYNDIVDWNTPPSDLQEDVREIILQFGTPRFRNDGVDRDVITFWNRKISAIPLVGNFFTVATEFELAMLMSNGKSAFPKLLIWGNPNNKDRALVQRYTLPLADAYDGKDTGDRSILDDVDKPIQFVQNYPYHFDQERDISTANLYRYHRIDNPRESKEKLRNYEFSAEFSCGFVSDFDVTKSIDFGFKFVRGFAITDPNVPPTIPSNPGQMDSVTINYSTKIIKIKGRL